MESELLYVLTKNINVSNTEMQPRPPTTISRMQGMKSSAAACVCRCVCASVLRGIFNPSAFTGVHNTHTHTRIQNISDVMWGPSESRSTPADSNTGETERFVKNYLRARHILIAVVFIKTNICASDTVI